MLKEKTYTLKEFLEKDRKEDENKKINFLATGLGTSLFLINNPTLAFANTGLDDIDKLGLTFLTIIRRLGYWIALICAIIDIIKCVREGGGKQDISQVIIKYIFIYAALFLIPKVFDLITVTLS